MQNVKGFMFHLVTNTGPLLVLTFIDLEMKKIGK